MLFSHFFLSKNPKNWPQFIVNIDFLDNVFWEGLFTKTNKKKYVNYNDQYPYLKSFKFVGLIWGA